MLSSKPHNAVSFRCLQNVNKSEGPRAIQYPRARPPFPPCPFRPIQYIHAYVQSAVKRNERLKDASLSTPPDNRCLQGGSRAGAASATRPTAVSAAGSNSPAAIGRKLLSRPVTYASMDALPDPAMFELHEVFEGWTFLTGSSSASRTYW